jgi:hypothetical protein
VLDPACGSGAFPMGMLQKLVAVLRKLDPDNALWKAQNRAPLAEQLASAKKLKDPTLRDEQTTAALAALEKFDADFADPDYADYARKLYLIEKCLYGVDIQPIAVQIAKLRFFISLVVEQKLGTDQPAPDAAAQPGNQDRRRQHPAAHPAQRRCSKTCWPTPTWPTKKPNCARPTPATLPPSALPTSANAKRASCACATNWPRYSRPS